ncbi:MAG TPA: tyrosine-type recombinase/integrase [Firmicutes bacterium]|nr:tyrosine-type recombinase/integrase [Bacillota bacterium]
MASYKQIGENKYKIYVELGYDDNGKRIRKTKTVIAKSERALKKAITELEVEVRNTKTMDLDGISFETFYEEHFKKLYLKTLKVSTQNLYKENEGRVLNFFKGMEMKKIKPLHIEKFFEAEENAGRRTLDKKHSMLKSIFERAKEWEVIDSNPAKKVKNRKPEKQVREIQHYTKEQVKILIRELENNATEKLNVQAKLAVLCGLRRGEIMALCIEDVDFKTKTISVNKNLQVILDTNEKILQSPKNGKGRIVPMNTIVEHDLKKYIFKIKQLKFSMGELWEQQKDMNGNNITFLFSNEIGQPQSLKGLNRQWYDFCKKSPIPYLNFHGLRHTYATLLVQSGTNINVVQKLLGHSDIRVTLNKYTHTEMDDLIEGVKVFDIFL